ncbi:hypothetical protein GQX74_015237 [Glossina fuscipes]|nr:hypothetical protein GQX74_015237 [Glossina fuscipes]
MGCVAPHKYSEPQPVSRTSSPSFMGSTGCLKTTQCAAVKIHSAAIIAPAQLSRSIVALQILHTSTSLLFYYYLLLSKNYILLVSSGILSLKDARLRKQYQLIFKSVTNYTNTTTRPPESPKQAPPPLRVTVHILPTSSRGSLSNNPLQCSYCTYFKLIFFNIAGPPPPELLIPLQPVSPPESPKQAPSPFWVNVHILPTCSLGSLSSNSLQRSYSTYFKLILCNFDGPPPPALLSAPQPVSTTSSPSSNGCSDINKQTIPNRFIRRPICLPIGSLLIGRLLMFKHDYALHEHFLLPRMIFCSFGRPPPPALVSAPQPVSKTSSSSSIACTDIALFKCNITVDDDLRARNRFLK